MQKTASQSTIVLGFTAILGLMLLLAAISVTLILNRSADIDQVIAASNYKQQLIIEMRRASRERTVSLQKMLILSDPFSQDEELQRFWQHGAAFISARNELINKLELPEEQALFEMVMALVRTNAPRQIEIADSIMAGEINSAKTALEDEIIPRQIAIYNGLTELLELQKKYRGTPLSAQRSVTTTRPSSPC